MIELNYPTTKNEEPKGEAYKLFSLGAEIIQHKNIDIKKLKNKYNIKENSYKPFFVEY